MLRPTLLKWLERRTIRPGLSRATRSSGRVQPTQAGHRSAAAPPSALYHSGDADDLDGAESLDLMDDDDVPIEPFGRPASAVPAPRHAAHPTRTTRPPPATHGARGAGSGGGGLPAAQQEAPWAAEEPPQRPAPPAPTRRVITVTRRPHGAASEAAPAHGSTAHGVAPLSRSPRETPAEANPDDADVDVDTPHRHHRAGPAEDGEDGEEAAAASEMGGVGGGGGSDGAHVRGAEDAEGDAVSAATAAKSSDAYRFLLNHIDAEIAALQRRHASVTTRRQSVQTRQTQRIKELFDVMEHPWTLLPSEVQPALPATGVDVYIKEQQLARQQQNPSHEGQDKMYVLALHKNYKSMPAGRKRFYEEAAHYNAAVREELKYQLTRGCARFEAFLDTIKECTMEMAREGKMPELPSTHAQNRFQAARNHAAAQQRQGGGAPSRRPAGHAGAPGSSSMSGRADAAAESAGGDGAAAHPAEAEHAGSGAGRGGKQTGSAASGSRKSVGKASSRVKQAAKKSKPAPSTASGAAAKGRKASAPASSKKPATPKAAASGGAKAKKGGAAGAGRRGKKGAARAAPGGGAGSSRSIPLPNLDLLALKKVKQMMSGTAASAAAGGKKAGKKAPAAAPKAAAAKKKKKK